MSITGKKGISCGKPAPTAPVDSVNGKTGIVVIDKTDVGLSNVDNTSDADKPISTLTQTALDNKQDFDVETTKNNVAQEFTKQHNFKETALTNSTSLEWDLEDNQNTKVILSSDNYLFATNIKDGSLCTLTAIQDATGSRLIRFSNVSFKFSGGAEPVLSTAANSIDVLRFVASGGTLNFVGIEKNLVATDAVITSRNPVFWGDSEDIATSGANVTQINDKGSLGYDLTVAAGTMTLSDINGVPAIDYGTGAQNRMEYAGLVPISDISDSDAMTIFWVQEVKVTGGSQNWALSWDSTSDTKKILIGSPDTVYAGNEDVRITYGTIGGIGDNLRSTVADINTEAKVFAFVKRGNNTGALYSNGSLVLDTVMDGVISSGSGKFSIGSTYLGNNPVGQFKGLIAEEIVFKGALDLTAINEISAYLQDKYSIV